jgi:type IV pilus assembly protein PilE
MRRLAQGATLVELVVVMTIVATLAGIAVPAFRGYLLRANRAEARVALLALAAAEENFYLRCGTYAAGLGSGTAAACSPASLAISSTSERGYYAISVAAADAGAWTATATAAAGRAQYDDTRCRVLRLTSQGLKSATDAAGSSNDEECWRR